MARGAVEAGGICTGDVFVMVADTAGGRGCGDGRPGAGRRTRGRSKDEECLGVFGICGSADRASA